MIELIAAINIMCSQYPYKAHEIIPNDVYKSIGYVFQLKSDDAIPSSRKVNEFCMNVENNKK